VNAWSLQNAVNEQRAKVMRDKNFHMEDCNPSQVTIMPVSLMLMSARGAPKRPREHKVPE